MFQRLRKTGYALLQPVPLGPVRLRLSSEIKQPGVSILTSAAFVPLQSQTHSFTMGQASAALRLEL